MHVYTLDVQTYCSMHISGGGIMEQYHRFALLLTKLTK